MKSTPSVRKYCNVHTPRNKGGRGGGTNIFVTCMLPPYPLTEMQLTCTQTEIRGGGTNAFVTCMSPPYPLTDMQLYNIRYIERVRPKENENCFFTITFNTRRLVSNRSTCSLSSLPNNRTEQDYNNTLTT